MKFKDLAALGNEERRIKMKDLKLELMKLNTQVATGTPPKNAGTVSRIKKDIARLMLLDTMKVASDKKNEKAAPKKAAVEKKSKK